MINTVAITGYLTRDSELKKTKSELSVLEFSVAVNERRRDGDEWVDYPNYFDCTIFGKRADALNKYLKKGTKVSITGALHQDRWEQDGQNRSRVRVIVGELDFMSAGKTDDSNTVDYDV